MLKEALVIAPSMKQPKTLPLDVAVIIVSWNVRHYLAECLRSTFQELDQSGLLGEVWLIDNASTDGTPGFITDLYTNVHLVSNSKNLGFGAANNQGMRMALEGDHLPRYFFLLNPDTLVRPSSIGRMVEWMDRNPKVGITGSRLTYGNGRLQHSAFRFPGLSQLIFEFWPALKRWYDTPLNGRYPMSWYKAYTPFRVDHTLGAAMMVRQELFTQTGGFDESFHIYCEEIDWAWRVRQAGWDIYTVPSAEIVHYGGESTKQVRAQSVINLWQSRARLYQQHLPSWKLRVAKQIVRSGLSQLATTSPTPELKMAYREALSAWK